MTTSPAQHTVKISQAARQLQIKRTALAMAAVYWEEKPEQYCQYRLDGKLSAGWLRLKQYTNGTLFLQASSEALMQNLCQELGVQAPAGSPASFSADKPAPRNHSSEKKTPLVDESLSLIGTDEAGKGDYFGPLVVAGVCMPPNAASDLKKLGVADSKKLSGQAIETLSKNIFALLGEPAIAIACLMPETYNQRYQQLNSQGKNLNHLLANAHAAVIATLLENNPTCSQVMVDQFAKGPVLETALKQAIKPSSAINTSSLRLIQQTGAESLSLAVAAASIVARSCYVKSLGELSQQYGVTLMPGAGDPTLRVGREWVRCHGHQNLYQVAKVHFKTTQQLY